MKLEWIFLAVIIFLGLIAFMTTVENNRLESEVIRLRRDYTYLQSFVESKGYQVLRDTLVIMGPIKGKNNERHKKDYEKN